MRLAIGGLTSVDFYSILACRCGHCTCAHAVDIHAIMWCCRGEFAKMLAATPWGDKSRRHFLTREEEYVGALQASLGIW